MSKRKSMGSGKGKKYVKTKQTDNVHINMLENKNNDLNSL